MAYIGALLNNGLNFIIFELDFNPIILFLVALPLKIFCGLQSFLAKGHNFSKLQNTIIVLEVIRRL